MNEHWSRLIVDHLIQQGIHYFCLSPGSRSSPLAFAIAEEERARSFVHFDERGCAFHAFGYAKAAKEPVVLICTSGSAVANFFPAIMAASLENIPLIILTADRPPELRDCGANQTCDQVKIFGNYVRWECDIPCPDTTISENYIGSTIAHAVYRAKHSPQGPVHLNCMFREPLFNSPSSLIPDDILRGAQYQKPSTHYESSHATLSSTTLEHWGKKLSKNAKGVIVVGALSSSRSLKPIYALAEHLHFPILPDILSGMRGDHDSPLVIPYYDTILKNAPDLNPDCILHLGDALVSKTLLKWIHNSAAPIYALVADHPFRHDPSHTLTHRLQCDPSLFCQQVLPFITPTSSSIEVWKNYSATIESQIDLLVGNLREPTEPGLIRFLHHHIPLHYSLFLSNSLPVREADQFFFPRYFRGSIFSNRGISGIDGNIATAIGIAEGSQRPTIALLGDLASLHDINSLAQVHKAKYPVIFIVMNNHGGGIFSFLPTPPNKKEFFEEFLAEAHPFSFEHAAALFKLPYHKIKDFDSLSKAFREEKSSILELVTNREENFALQTHIASKLKECLLSCTVS